MVDQLALPKTICAPPRNISAATTPGISAASAAASSSVSVQPLPPPVRTPPEVRLPDITMIRFEPDRNLVRHPFLRASTDRNHGDHAPTPMMMPSMVGMLRSRLVRSARSATRRW